MYECTCKNAFHVSLVENSKSSVHSSLASRQSNKGNTANIRKSVLRVVKYFYQLFQSQQTVGGRETGGPGELGGRAR